MTTEPSDLYTILGVSAHATQAEISHAYRALLRRNHPDTRATDESHSTVSDATLQQVLAAYTVLGDPARRADYDRRTKPDRCPKRLLRQRLIEYRADRQPPIVAGPVRWHRRPDLP